MEIARWLNISRSLPSKFIIMNHKNKPSLDTITITMDHKIPCPRINIAFAAEGTSCCIVSLENIADVTGK